MFLNFLYELLKVTKKQKTILVAPLHWGLGHATRCIPIISELLKHGFDVVIASDGAALLLLRKEFPELHWVELPSYNITYPKNGAYFKWSLLLKLPKIKKTIASEKRMTEKLLSEIQIDGIISDNRFGVRSKEVPSVFITHQLNVLTGSTSFLSSRIHKKVIKQFNECWVPDVATAPNLSGRLGHLIKTNINIKYVGILSRIKPKKLPIKYDIFVLISGPEPQREIFEKTMMEAFLGNSKKILLVRGKIEVRQTTNIIRNITIVNFMQTKDLETAINQSDIIISRPGYTTLMDLSVLGKKAFFIPTPGQYEQEYLAKRLKESGIAPYSKQDNFTANRIVEIAMYKGLPKYQSKTDFSKLFGLFEGK